MMQSHLRAIIRRSTAKLTGNECTSFKSHFQDQRKLAKCFSVSAANPLSTGENLIEQSREDAVQLITFNRPKSKNAVNNEVCNAFSKAVHEAEADDSVNIIAITGNGDFFTSGNDLMALKNASNLKEYAENTAFNVMSFFAALIDCKKPVVALVNGPAVGLGVTMLGLSDAVYASTAATFSTPFSLLGICAEGCSSYTFPRIMGYSNASSMLLFHRVLTAEEAEKYGLVSQVIPQDKFRAETLAKIRAMAKLPIKSLIYSKELVRGRERAILHEVNKKEMKGVEMFLQSQECYDRTMKMFSKKKK